MLRAEFGYETKNIRWIVLLLIGIDVLTIGLMMLTVNEEENFEWFAVSFSVFMIGITLLFGISPLFTKHEVHDTYILLRQGWYYRNRIDLTDIERITLVKHGPFAIGYHYIDGHTGILNGRMNDLIMLEMRPVKNHNGKKRRITRVLFDTEDNDGFMRAIMHRYDAVQDSYR